MNKKNNKIVGNFGEGLARLYLILKGYKILDYNYFTPHGEIDIICKKRNFIVFIEVKTRSSKAYGFPAQAVDYYKKNHIIRSAEYYICKNNIKNTYFRFDVIEVFVSKGFIFRKINHIINAFNINLK